MLHVDPISPDQGVWLVFKSSSRTESRSERDVHELSWLEILGSNKSGLVCHVRGFCVDGGRS